jgi:hypothetical protein
VDFTSDGQAKSWVCCGQRQRPEDKLLARRWWAFESSWTRRPRWAWAGSLDSCWAGGGLRVMWAAGLGRAHPRQAMNHWFESAARGWQVRGIRCWVLDPSGLCFNGHEARLLILSHQNDRSPQQRGVKTEATDIQRSMNHWFEINGGCQQLNATARQVTRGHVPSEVKEACGSECHQPKGAPERTVAGSGL